jgi:hypothetical protein
METAKDYDLHPMRRVYTFDLAEGQSISGYPVDGTGFSWAAAADWFPIRTVRRIGERWCESSQHDLYLNPAHVAGVWTKGELPVAPYGALTEPF